MIDEQVDIIDLDGKILYTTSKVDAHVKGLLHKCVIAEVIDSNGNWFLVKPKSNRQDGGQFVSPVGGHVSSNESEIDALKRETFEEVGLINFRFKYIGRSIFNRKILGRVENHQFVLFEIYTDDNLELGEEGEECKKFSLAKIKEDISKHPALFGDAFHFVCKNIYHWI